HTDGHGALQAIKELSPDLLFLDVKMPGLDGFGVLNSLRTDAGGNATDSARLPVVIFVTAFDRYALRAFDAHALDYLVKPLDRERCEKAVRRPKSEILSGRTGSQSRRSDGGGASAGGESAPGESTRLTSARLTSARQILDLLGYLKPANYLERLVV